MTLSETIQKEGKGAHPVVTEYARLAGKYDTRWSFYIQATIRATLSRLSVRPTDHLLDVGCGTGALLEQLVRAGRPARMVGVDPVPEMLVVARRRLPPSVELSEGWAEQLPCGDESFDVVVSCNMFHYIRRPVVALREMKRVLRPGGRLLITDWCDDYLACRMCDWYLRLFSPAHFKVYRARECLNLLHEVMPWPVDIEHYKLNWLWGVMTARVTKQANLA